MQMLTVSEKKHDHKNLYMMIFLMQLSMTITEVNIQGLV